MLPLSLPHSGDKVARIVASENGNCMRFYTTHLMALVAISAVIFETSR